MLGFFTNLNLTVFPASYLALFCLLSVVDGFWMASLRKIIQFMQVFLKVSFLVVQFSCYSSMAFLMMLSVILVSILMILLSSLSVIRNLICGNN